MVRDWNELLEFDMTDSQTLTVETIVQKVCGETMSSEMTDQYTTLPREA